MIEPYSNTKHYRLLAEWMAARKLNVPTFDDLSPLGFVVDKKAIGFFYVFGKRALLEGFAADHTIPARERDAAVRKLTRHILKVSRMMGCTTVLAFTAVPTMRKRFSRMGFHAHGDYTLYSRRTE